MTGRDLPISFIIILIIIALCPACQSVETATSTTAPREEAALTATATATATTPPRAASDPTSLPAPSRQPAGPNSRTVSAVGPMAPHTVDQVELIDTLTGHTDRVYGLCFSSDGRWLASGGWDDTIRVWDVASREQMHALDIDGNWDVFFAPDDEHVASARGAIWDIATGQEVQSFAASGEQARFSPDGAWMASAGYNAPIKVWDVGTGQVVQTLEGHSDRVFGLAFSYDGSLLASGSGMGPSDVSDYTVKIWDLESGREMHALQGHSGDVHAVAFSPDGALVASASTDYTVRLWDVRSGELVHNLWHRDGLWDVAFSPDGALLASGGVARQVRLWDVASGQELRALRHQDEVMAVAFSPDGTLLAAGGYDNMVYLWGIPR